jgi:hypothetical protein
LSPQDVELISQQRVHFLDHIRISVGHLESLIDHQQALVDIITRPSCELSTGVPVVYPDELPTAHRVPTGSPTLSSVPHNTVEPPHHPPQLPTARITSTLFVADTTLVFIDPGHLHAHKSTVTPITNTAVSTPLTTLGHTFTALPHPVRSYRRPRSCNPYQPWHPLQFPFSSPPSPTTFTRAFTSAITKNRSQMPPKVCAVPLTTVAPTL